MSEIGKKTMSDAKYGNYLLRFPNSAERGRALIAEQGWIRGVLPEGHGWMLGIGKTFKTGPTPAGWAGVGAGAGAEIGGYYLWNRSEK